MKLKFRKDFGIATTENIGNNFQEAIQYPALGILGMEAAWVGNQTRERLFLRQPSQN